MSFKILAIRPLTHCAKNILKNLVPEEFYFFDNSYKPTKDRSGIEKHNKNQDRTLPNDFFSIKSDFVNNDSTLTNINIQAIVGKNGSGKSSLVELLLRILNNFFKNKEYNTLTNKLRYAKGVNAELYFYIKEARKDEVVYKMTVDTSGVKFQGDPFVKETCTVEPEISDISKQLFFTMYVNYSLYGLDSKDYLNETIDEESNEHGEDLEDEDLKPWIGRVFHKNDGYQTQLVIHPWRKAGQIDIRNEKELMRQRLLSQIILDKSFNKLTDEQTIQSFKFTFRGQDYLQKYFHNFSDLKENSTSDSTNIFVYGTMERFFNIDINIRQSGFYELIQTIVLNSIYKGVQGPLKQKYNKFWTPLEGFEDYLYLVDSQLREIAIFSLCFQALERKVGKFDLFIRKPFLENLFIYALVKLRKIIKYPRLSHLNYNYDKLNSANTKPSKLIEDIIKIMDDDSHISVKLRQAIEILRLVKKDPNNNLLTFYQKIVDGRVYEIENIIDLRKIIEEVMRDFKIEPVYLVPPQIFDVDILLGNQNSKENIFTEGKDLEKNSWKNISSGEFQKIGIISSLIYHLRNLDSVKGGANSKGKFYNYENINIMLDEIELYFHPEYQRTFIYDLISRLQKIMFKNITNINITFITHSPFILSDIPSQNILKLENGIPKESDIKNSFASNIHDLLKDEFFLEKGYMGEFANNKIKDLITTLNEWEEPDNNFDRKEKDDIFKFIQLIGEPLIKRSLLDLYHEKIGLHESEFNLDQIDDEIKRLENLKKRINR